MKIKEFKSHNKKLAQLVKEDKQKYKDCQRKTLSWADYTQWKRESGYLYIDLKREYRHNHIAYCMLRGTKYEAIEPKVKDGNRPDWNFIESIMANYREIENIECGEVVNV